MASENRMMDPPLCAKNCGFFGSLTTKNMCSKCYNEFLKQELIEKTAVAPSAVVDLLEKLHISTESPSNSSLDDDHHQTAPTVDLDCATKSTKSRLRCPCCNKKLGLLGFNCACGGVFCGQHRYPEKHSCVMDFKKGGREMLAKQNPVCKGDKLEFRL